MARRTGQRAASAQSAQQILTNTELQEENRQLRARIAQLEGPAQTQTATRQEQTNKVPRVAIRPLIPEADLGSKNYLVRQHMRTHPDLTESEALGDLCSQYFHMRFPIVKRQEEARLAKQTNQGLTQRASAQA